MAAGQNWGVNFRINTTALGTLASQATKIADATANLKKFGDEANRQLGALNDTLGKLKLSATATEVAKIAAAARGAGNAAGGGGGGGFNAGNINRKTLNAGRGENISNALARHLGMAQNEFGSIYGKETPKIGRGGGLDANQAMATILYARVTNPLLIEMRKMTGAYGKGSNFDMEKLGQELTSRITNPINQRLDKIVDLLGRNPPRGGGNTDDGGDRGGPSSTPHVPPSRPHQFEQRTVNLPTIADIKAAGVAQAAIANTALVASGRANEGMVKRAKAHSTAGRADRTFMNQENAYMEKATAQQTKLRDLDMETRAMKTRQADTPSPKLARAIEKNTATMEKMAARVASLITKAEGYGNRSGGTVISDLQGAGRAGSTQIAGTQVGRGATGGQRVNSSVLDTVVENEQARLRGGTPGHLAYLSQLRAEPAAAAVFGKLAAMPVRGDRLDQRVRGTILSRDADLWNVQSRAKGANRQAPFNPDKATALLADTSLIGHLGAAFGVKKFGDVIRKKPGTNKDDSQSGMLARLLYAMAVVREKAEEMDSKITTAVANNKVTDADARRGLTPGAGGAMGMSNATSAARGRRGVGRSATRMGMFSSGSVTDENGNEFREGRDYNLQRGLLTGQNRFTSQKQFHSTVSRAVNWGGAATLAYGGTQQLKSGVEMMSQYERAMMDVRRVASPLGFDIQKVSSAAQDLGKTFGMSILDAGKAMTIFAQQGMDMQGVIDSTRASMVLSNTTGMSLVESTEALTATQRQFQISTAQSMRIIDAWTAVANTTAIGADTLGDAMRLAGTSMRVAGVDFDTANGFIAALGESTRKSGEEIGTAMKFIFQHVREDKAIQSLQQIGVYTEDSAGKMKSATTIIDELSHKWDTLTAAQQQEIAVAISGTRHLNDFYVLMDTTQRRMDITTSSMSSQGSAMKQNAKLMDTLEKQVGQLKAAYEGLWVALGNSGVITTVKSLVGLMSQLLDGFGKVNTAGMGIPAAIATAAVGYKGAQIGSQVLGDAVLPALFETTGTATAAGRRRARQLARQREREGFVPGPNSSGMSNIDPIFLGEMLDDDAPHREPGSRRRGSFFNRRTGSIAAIGAGIAAQGVYEKMSDRQPGEPQTAGGLAADLVGTTSMSAGIIGLLKRPGSLFSPKAQGASGVLMIPFVLGAVAKIADSIGKFRASNGSGSTNQLQEEIEGLRGQQEKMASTRSLIQEQTRRAAGGGDIDPDVLAEIRDQMAVLGPETRLAAEGTGALVGNMKEWLGTIRKVDDGLRRQSASLSGRIAATTEGSDDFKKAQATLDSTAKVIQQNRGRGAQGLSDNYAILAQRSGARREMTNAFRTRLAEASEAGSTDGTLDLSQERLSKMGDTYRQSPELIGRQLLRAFVNSMGRGNVQLDKQLGNRSVGSMQYVQLDKNGPVRSIATGQYVKPGSVDPNSIVRTEDALFGNAAPRLKTQNLGKLMVEFERAVESLIAKNQRLVNAMESSSQAIASREYGQNFTGTATGFDLANREASTLLGIERNGMRGISGVGGGTANDVGKDIVRMLGQLVAGGANGTGISMRGVMDVMGKAQDFENSTLQDARRRGSVLVRNGGKAISDDATDEDIEKSGGDVAAIRALKRVLDSDAISRIGQLASRRSAIEQEVKGGNTANAGAIADIDRQADDIVAGSVKAKTRELRSGGTEYVTRNLERIQGVAERSISELARGYQLSLITNPALTPGQYAEGGEGRRARGNISGFASEVGDLMKVAIQNRDMIADKGSSEYAEADAFVTLTTERFRTLADASKNLTDLFYNAGRGAQELQNSFDRASTLAGLGGGFGQTGTAGQAFSGEMFRQFAQDFMAQAEKEGNEQRSLQLRTAAEQLKARADAADFQVGLSKDIQKALIKGVPSQYLANRATAAIGLGVGGTGAELRESATDTIQSSLQMLARDFAEGREVTRGTGDAFVQQLQPQLSKLATIVQDMKLGQSPEYQKNYMLASPSEQALADYVRQQMDQGATSEEIFSDPMMRNAARENGLVGNLLDQSIQRDSSAQMLNLAGSSDSKLGQAVDILKEIANHVSGDRAARGLGAVNVTALPFAKGTMDSMMSPAGHAAVDGKGRIKQDGTLAQLHEGEVVLNKKQTRALFENKFAAGTMSHSTFKQVAGMDAEKYDLTKDPALFKKIVADITANPELGRRLGIDPGTWSSLMGRSEMISERPKNVNWLNEAFYPRATVGNDKTVSLSGRTGISLATLFGSDEASRAGSAMGILGHEATHIGDFAINPRALVERSGNARLQNEVMLHYLQRMMDDAGPAGDLIRERVATGYSGSFGSQKRRVGKGPQDLFTIVSEARAARNQLAGAGTHALDPIDLKLNDLLARGSKAMLGAKGMRADEYNKLVRNTLVEARDLLLGAGYDGAGLADTTFGDLQQRLLRRGVPVTPASVAAATPVAAARAARTVSLPIITSSLDLAPYPETGRVRRLNESRVSRVMSDPYGFSERAYLGINGPRQGTVRAGEARPFGPSLGATDDPYEMRTRPRMLMAPTPVRTRGMIYEYAGTGGGPLGLNNPGMQITRAGPRGVTSSSPYELSIRSGLSAQQRQAAVNPIRGNPTLVDRVANANMVNATLRRTVAGVNPYGLGEDLSGIIPYAKTSSYQPPVAGPAGYGVAGDYRSTYEIRRQGDLQKFLGRSNFAPTVGRAAEAFDIADFYAGDAVSQRVNAQYANSGYRGFVGPSMRPGQTAGGPGLLARAGGYLTNGVENVDGFGRPSLAGTSARGLLGGFGRAVAGNRLAIGNTALIGANFFGEGLANRAGYGQQFRNYGDPALAGVNNLLAQQMLARTGSMQLLPRAFATVGMQETARGMVGASRLLGAAAAPLMAADLATRGGEILGNATGRKDISQASVAQRRMMFAPVILPYEMLAGENKVSGLDLDVMAKNKQVDRSLTDFLSPANFMMSGNSRGGAEIAAFADSEIRALTNQLAADMATMGGMLDDSVGSALLQQPIAKWGVDALAGTPGAAGAGGKPDYSQMLAQLPEELRAQILGNLDPSSPDFPIQAQGRKLRYEKRKISEALEQYRKYAAGFPAGYDSGQGSIISDLTRELASRQSQLKEIDSLSGGYRANGMADLGSAMTAALQNGQNLTDFSKPLVSGGTTGETWADFYMKMQGLDPASAAGVMAKGSRVSVELVKRKLGLDMNTEQWASVGATLPRTATMIDLINAASGKEFTDAQTAWMWLKENKGAFGGNAIEAARGRIAGQGSVTDLGSSNSFQRAMAEGVTGNQFDALLAEFAKSPDFDLYEQSAQTVSQQAANLLNAGRYDFRQTGADVTGQQKRIAEAMKSMGPMKEAFAAAQGAYGRLNTYPGRLQELFQSNPDLATRRNLTYGSQVDWFGVVNRGRPTDINTLAAHMSQVSEWMARAQSDLGAFQGIDAGRASLSKTGAKLTAGRNVPNLRLRSVRAVDAEGNPVLDKNGRPTFVSEAQSPDGKGWFNAADTKTAMEAVRGAKTRVTRIEADSKATLGRLSSAANSRGQPMDGERFLGLIRDPAVRAGLSEYESARFGLRNHKGGTAQDELARVNYQQKMDEIAISTGYGREFFEKAADAYDKLVQRQSEAEAKKAAQAARVNAARVKTAPAAQPYVGYDPAMLGLPGYESGTMSQRGGRLIGHDGLVAQDHLAVVHKKERVYPEQVSQGIDHLLELMRTLGNAPTVQSFQPADTMATDARQFMGTQPQGGSNGHVQHDGTINVTLEDNAVLDSLAERIVKLMGQSGGDGKLKLGESIPTWYER